eukprot:TRINITY_DN1626_c0_g4_i2.p1 TRINITY_DN1626_c0_g4~~TRINITY_DN1626_c0_g4_i2.p1  ORF type:complete len:428 (+),score=135.26 TRINITY_DN1626_c0_g4_i2:143-1285(+)
MAALTWILMLHLKLPEQLFKHVDELFPALLKLLSDPVEDVVRLDLEVLGRISQNETYFTMFMSSLIQLFSTDRTLLEDRGSLIIRQLSFFLDPEKIICAFANILENETDLEFASLMIVNLNLICLTSPEYTDLRSRLKALNTEEGKQLFMVLYKSWCHSPVATFSLCLLSQAVCYSSATSMPLHPYSPCSFLFLSAQYEHACELVFKFANMELTVGFLMELDKMIQLLESPIFTNLRLQLLEPEKYPYLYKSLYGILMLLPQSSAFHTLKNRLNSVSSLTQLHMLPNSELVPSQNETVGEIDVDFAALLDHFDSVQKKHQVVRTNIFQERSLFSSSADFLSTRSKERKVVDASSSSSAPKKQTDINSFKNTNVANDDFDQ